MTSLMEKYQQRQRMTCTRLHPKDWDRCDKSHKAYVPPVTGGGDSAPIDHPKTVKTSGSAQGTGQALVTTKYKQNDDTRVCSETTGSRGSHRFPTGSGTGRVSGVPRLVPGSPAVKQGTSQREPHVAAGLHIKSIIWAGTGQGCP